MTDEFGNAEGSLPAPVIVTPLIGWTGLILYMLQKKTVRIPSAYPHLDQNLLVYIVYILANECPYIFPAEIFVRQG